MGGDVEVIGGNNLGLGTLATNYRDIEKKFGDIIWGQIGKLFPEDFDKSLLKLDDALANILINADEEDGGTHLVRINHSNYNGVITELYERMKGLHLLELDDFYIEVEGYNFRNERNNFHLEETSRHQINFRIKRKTKVIDGQVVGEDRSVKGKVVGLIRP